MDYDMNDTERLHNFALEMQHAIMKRTCLGSNFLKSTFSTSYNFTKCVEANDSKRKKQ
jgi:hypothetical protein